MIKLNLRNPFKSLAPFQIDLPDFVVLTGLNGAGKTQILNAIQSNLMILTNEAGQQLNPKKYVTSHSLTPNNSAIVTREQLSQATQGLWEQFSKNYLVQKQKNPNYSLTNVYGVANAPQIKTIGKIAKFAEKEIDKLSSEDFYNYYPIEDGLQQTDVFHQNFSSLFKRYQDKYEENGYRQYKCDIKGLTEITYLTEEEFLKTYGEAPWDFVNKIIQEANLDYHIKVPQDYNRDAPFELKLINNLSQAEINFIDLSSGEKVLMSLALALYNSNFDIEFPKVLLMDEPDASLHPSMSKKFLNVVQEVFVKQKGVKVIITTHSPSTVALTPEEAIYVVNKGGQRVEKSSKDYALSILTSGLPSFSINYENRRQVFVESENDVIYYEKIYRKLNNFLQPEISLGFISSGDSRTDKNGVKVSNCAQVVSITGILRGAGNNFIWGIIDWDTSNTTSDFIKVIGDGNRYSIESYLFDPILLGALLLREKIITRENLGLNENQTYTDFKNLTVTDLQRIADFVVKSLETEFDTTQNELKSVGYINGIQVSIPMWYLHHNGHELEEKILKIYPQLNGIKKGKEEALKIEIIEKIIDDIPELLPVDFLDVFKYVQK